MKPEGMWFFQRIRRLNEKQFQVRLQTVDEAFEIQALGHEIHAVSKKVAKKHYWVNCGFVLAGSSLILFLAAGMIYVVNNRGDSPLVPNQGVQPTASSVRSCVAPARGSG